ncbi:hypothetical protein TELCIR_06375 [Teladorsagia circumcincta]|uniref:Protein kinase domain-containing protein n=1 Tax=Teladorsagia circumcincta TaxID=45464 RepID=A0A2G9UN68_TELCI|nr:hypothetical protein TELCIR_06375 [Teladorsagia circumcincta]
MIYGHTHDHTVCFFTIRELKVVDNWAVGILLYEILVGRPPFEFPDQGRTVHAIVNCRFAIPPIVKEGPSDLMRKLIVKEPCMRKPELH